MADHQTLVFEFNGQPIRFPVGLTGTHLSPFTGREQHIVGVEVVCDRPAIEDGDADDGGDGISGAGRHLPDIPCGGWLNRGVRN